MAQNEVIYINTNFWLPHEEIRATKLEVFKKSPENVF